MDAKYTENKSSLLKHRQTGQVNGHLSQIFKAGAWQGCLLYMVVYILLVEIFLENIRQNNGIKGIAIGKKKLKISAFANDTAIYIGNNSCQTHLEIQLMHFEKSTYIKYNKTTCMEICLGSKKFDRRKPLGFK